MCMNLIKMKLVISHLILTLRITDVISQNLSNPILLWKMNKILLDKNIWIISLFKFKICIYVQIMVELF